MICIWILLWPSYAAAQTVYKTVEGGVTTFSDAPPVEGDAQVLTLDVPAPAEDGLLEERLAAMRETTDRMADDRREREKHRAELRDRQLASAQVPSTPTVITGGGYWTNFNAGWGHRSGFHRPGFNSPGINRPGAGAKPPYRQGRSATHNATAARSAPPGWSVMGPGNSQLMRPIVSSRP